MIQVVVLTSAAEKDLHRIPRRIVDKLLAWILAVESRGLEEVRRVPGYHDEPLQGRRAGQRSIRLSRSYRAIYRVVHGAVEFVRVEEVSKHDY